MKVVTRLIMANVLKRFQETSFLRHSVIAFIIRAVLIIYGEVHDRVSLVPYTDVDYKVFSDAARYVVNNESPYLRHTYRYTPALAIMLTPNIFLHPIFGKILFSCVDIIVGVLIKTIIMQNMNGNQKHTGLDEAKVGALFWLYNPLSIAISTRGNADSLAAFFVLATQYFLQKPAASLLDYTLAGILHGVAVHFRLYPIAFSLPMYIFLGRYKSITFFKLAVPNRNQCALVFGCVFTLSSLTFCFYRMYSNEFLYETYYYHLMRSDTRHNFSVYFYLLYLSAGVNTGIWQKILTFSPQLVLLLVLCFRYASNIKTLNFCLFCQSVVMVAYNPVVTSQYFIWFLSLLPLCLKDIHIPIGQLLRFGLVWTVTQLAWLLPAFLLEFKGQNVFLYVWLQGIAFFCANLFILARFIKQFKPM